MCDSQDGFTSFGLIQLSQTAYEVVNLARLYGKQKAVNAIP